MPVACAQSTSLPRVYRLFRGLGLRHLLVIADGSGARERADSGARNNKSQSQSQSQYGPASPSGSFVAQMHGSEHQRHSVCTAPAVEQSPRPQSAFEGLPPASAAGRPATRSASSMSDELSRGGAFGLGAVGFGSINNAFVSPSPVGPLSSLEARPTPCGGRVCGIITRKDLKQIEMQFEHH